MVHQAIHAPGGVLLSAKAPKSYVGLQKLKKMQKKLAGGNVFKFSVGFSCRKLPSECLLRTSSSTQNWKSTFSSKSAEYLRKIDKIQNVSPTKTMLAERFR